MSWCFWFDDSLANSVAMKITDAMAFDEVIDSHSADSCSSYWWLQEVIGLKLRHTHGK